MRPRSGSGGPYTLDAVSIFVYVLAGSFVITVDGATSALNACDCLTFGATLLHEWHNPTDDDAEVLWVIAPPIATEQLRAVLRGQSAKVGRTSFAFVGCLSGLSTCPRERCSSFKGRALEPSRSHEDAVGECHFGHKCRLLVARIPVKKAWSNYARVFMCAALYFGISAAIFRVSLRHRVDHRRLARTADGTLAASSQSPDPSTRSPTLRSPPDLKIRCAAAVSAGGSVRESVESV